MAFPQYFRNESLLCTLILALCGRPRLCRVIRSDTEEVGPLALRCGNPAPACRREAKLGCDAHHDFGLAVRDRDVGDG